MFNPQLAVKIGSWRMRADRYRAQADGSSAPAVRDTYEQLACNCEMVAEWLEERFLTRHED